ncbi:MAG: hypothetical protein J7M26_01885 [Armatimonadetes bacterium]|nr:hypothetical protein [Armatimonadota bacterium]
MKREPKRTGPYTGYLGWDLKHLGPKGEWGADKLDAEGKLSLEEIFQARDEFEGLREQYARAQTEEERERIFRRALELANTKLPSIAVTAEINY